MRNIFTGMKNFLSLQKRENDFIWMKVNEIKIHEEMEKLFSINKDIYNKIYNSIMLHGYDTSQPVVVGRIKKIGDYLVDGHTRLKASIEAGEKEIPVKIKNFDSLDDALCYTLKRQSERRNLSQREILNASMSLVKKKKRDGSGRSTDNLSEELGISASTIQHAQTVARNASEDDLNAIYDGEKSINEVYQKLKKQNDIKKNNISTNKKRKPENKNNKLNKTEGNIEIKNNESSLVDNNYVTGKEEENKVEIKKENKTSKLLQKKDSIPINDKILEEILRLLKKENLLQAINVIVKHYGNYLLEEFKKEMEVMIE